VTPVELLLAGERLTIPVIVPAPVQRGSVEVCLAPTRDGTTAAPALARRLVVEGGVIPPLTLFARDVREAWPRGGRAWLVVRYGETVVGAGEVRLVR
jgi:hypothetical protein